jgi:hypothetical protein
MVEYMLIGGLVAGFISGVICYAIAGRKGLSTTNWFLIGLGCGFAFGVFGALIAVGVAATRKERRPCPRCAVRIPVDSTVCPNCWLPLVAYPGAAYPAAGYAAAAYPPYGYPAGPAYPSSAPAPVPDPPAPSPAAPYTWPPAPTMPAVPTVPGEPTEPTEPTDQA